MRKLDERVGLLKEKDAGTVNCQLVQVMGVAVVAVLLQLGILASQSSMQLSASEQV